MDRPSYGYSADDVPPPQDGPGGQEQGQPVCPRHPDRVSYVRCKRCDRPACPECQRPASVGVLCADCAREVSRQRASTRPRNAMGGAMGRSRPLVTYTLIGLCVLAYLGQMAAPQIVTQLAIFAPFRALAMPWTFFTAGFLHGGVLHLALNMYALWAVGQYLERTLGHVRYLAVYLVSVLGGHTAVYLLADATSQEWVTGTLGASGGVFGLFAAMFIVNRHLGGQTAQILVLIGLNLVITFTVPNISWQGHLGGLLLGAAMTAGMFALRPRAAPGADRQALARRSALVHAGVITAGVLLCLALIALKAMMVLAL
ncbi:rhomboid family intramembrane serine protease [Brachybacterium saurashtrense]|uniref:Rhomboid family intramembrane serine protease n=1 Tax=Brachybacterium saurashtrense TaxID=556288 RepID=A0A345YSB0_9MICO|nr:rhomboid family intramembrane serine protease [Brachybacterium saurashtrense]AXK46812.1 rhomboid family intramembrane serine protease [Brachybacterium saurashtrense]RRR22527.1 rhomboid family intramembrane serine protease [Brachybacterium saurashtrense]